MTHHSQLSKSRQNKKWRKDHPNDKKEYFDKNPIKYKINQLKQRILYHQRRLKMFRQKLKELEKI